MPQLIELTGRTFGKWTVIRPGKKVAGKLFWFCRCECGLEKEVKGKHLRDGESTQCRGCSKRTHGATNGKSPTVEYTIWHSMIDRCHNQKNHAYNNYGGRGIVVCDRWRHSFEAFLADMGPRPDKKTLDRFPNQNGNYEPGNCRWATWTQQQRNRRNNRLVSAFGKTLCVAEWCELLGIKNTLVRDRLNRGWDPERALSAGLVNGPSYAKE